MSSENEDGLGQTYVNGDGYRIMLSLEHAVDAAQEPEVRYSANGFSLSMVQDRPLPTLDGKIEVSQMSAHRGQRHDAVTSWFVDEQGTPKRTRQILTALTGQRRYGVFVRISSIDNDQDKAFAMHEKFIADMMASMPDGVRKRFTGVMLGPPIPGI